MRGPGQHYAEMGDEEDIAAESRAYGRKLPFVAAGALLLLLGVGLLGAGAWLWAGGAVAVGVTLVVVGEGVGRRS